MSNRPIPGLEGHFIPPPIQTYINDLLTKNMSFREFGLKLANEHSQHFKTDKRYENLFFEEAAKVSLEKQDEIDAQIEPDFESYLKEYFSQTS